MKRYVAGVAAALVLLAGCSAPTGGSTRTPARTGAAGAEKTPETEESYADSPSNPAEIERMLRAQGFKNVHKDPGGNAVDFDDPACPDGLAGNLGGIRIKDGRLHLLITSDGTDFLDVDRPPTRQQLDEHGICMLHNAA